MERVTGTNYRRVAPLIDNDLALYVAHLPLDGHQSLGNAAGVADLLDLDNRAPFGSMGGVYIGQQGTLAEPQTVSELADSLEGNIDTGGQSVQVLDFGPSTIEDVAIVTGSGVDWLQEAVETDATCSSLARGNRRPSTRRASRESTSFSPAITRRRRSASSRSRLSPRTGGWRRPTSTARLASEAMAETVSYEGIKSDSDLIAWSRAYCQQVRREYGVSVRFDLVDWDVSQRAKRRAAAVKRRNWTTRPSATGTTGTASTGATAARSRVRCR